MFILMSLIEINIRQYKNFKKKFSSWLNPIYRLDLSSTLYVATDAVGGSTGFATLVRKLRFLYFVMIYAD